MKIKHTHQKERVKVDMKRCDGKTCIENNNLRLECAMGYQEQITRLMHFVQGSKNVQRVQVVRATEIMKEIQTTLVKMEKEQRRFKNRLDDTVIFKVALKPYQDKLQEIIGEVDELCESK